MRSRHESPNCTGYDTPEIVAVPIVGGLDDYRAWTGTKTSSAAVKVTPALTLFSENLAIQRCNAETAQVRNAETPTCYNAQTLKRRGAVKL